MISAGFVSGVGGLTPQERWLTPPKAKKTNWGIVNEPPQGRIEKLFCFVVIEMMQHSA